MRVHAGRVPSIAVFALSAIAFVAGIQRGRVDAKGGPVQSSATPAGRAGGPQAPAGTGIVIGRVIDATTGRPVSGAIVMMTGGPTTAGASLSGLATSAGPAPDTLASNAPRQIMTDADGRFMFRALSKGRYTARVTATGYIAGGFGQNRPSGLVQPIELVTDDEKIPDLTVRLWKTATIAGTVLDELGDPVVGAGIRAFRRTVVNGQPRYAVSSSATSDDRGTYRMANLNPGSYIVGIISASATMPTSVPMRTAS